MSPSEKELAPSVPLRRSADRLHVIISAPSGVLPEPRLRGVLRHELESLRELLLGHFASEEEGGYLADIVRASPELGAVAEELRAEHAVLRKDFDALVADAAAAPLGQLVERIGATLETFDAHEHAEAKLIAGEAK